MPTEPIEPIRIFVSYAREDSRWLDESNPYNLIPVLGQSLKRLGVVFWWDTNIVASEPFAQKIREEIDRADIAILIVSQAFLYSEYIEANELPRIKERALRNELSVVSFLVEKCAWTEDEFLSARQMLPSSLSPLIYSTRDPASWSDVKFALTEDLKKLIRKIRDERAAARRAEAIQEKTKAVDVVSPPIVHIAAPASSEIIVEPKEEPTPPYVFVRENSPPRRVNVLVPSATDVAVASAAAVQMPPTVVECVPEPEEDVVTDQSTLDVEQPVVKLPPPLSALETLRAYFADTKHLVASIAVACVGLLVIASLAALTLHKKPSPVRPGPNLQASAGTAQQRSNSGPASGTVVPAGGNIAAAIASANDGDTIYLSAGTYKLTNTLNINKSISLVGQGEDSTQVTFAGLVVNINALNVTVSNIGFTNSGKVGDVIDVGQTNFHIENCACSGAVWDGQNKAGGDGIYIFYNVNGTVDHCILDNNAHDGIDVNDSANPTLTNNECDNNTVTGISFIDHSMGNVSSNTCVGNHHCGIEAADTAQPTLTGNRCQQNGWSGILFFDNASGSATSNNSTNNVTSGISVQGTAHPTVSNNVCSHNTGAGIGYFDTAFGRVFDNQCSGNGSEGIIIEDSSTPNLSKNSCLHNKGAGICYFKNSSGDATSNTCNYNTLNGIAIEDTCHPTLTKNTCQYNVQDGIAFFDHSYGSVSGNHCIDNSGHGIFIEGTSKPTVGTNELSGNTEGDMQQAGGT